MFKLFVLFLLHAHTLNSHSLKTLTHTQLPEGSLLRVGSFNSNSNSDLLFFDSSINAFKIVKWKKYFTDFETETITLLTQNAPSTAISKITSLLSYDFNDNGFTDVLLYSNDTDAKTKTIILITKSEHSFTSSFITLEDTPQASDEQLSSLSLVFDVKLSTTVLLGTYYNSAKKSAVIYRLNLNTPKNTLSPKDVFVEFTNIDLSKYNNQEKLNNGKLVEIIQNDINGDNISDLLFIYNDTIKVAYSSNFGKNLQEIKPAREFDRVMVRSIKRNALPSIIAIKNSVYKSTDELNNANTVDVKTETAYIDVYHLKPQNVNSDSVFYEMKDALSKEVQIEGSKDTIDIPGIVDVERVTFSDINIEGNLEIVVPMFPNESERSKQSNGENNGSIDSHGGGKSGENKKEVRFYERDSNGKYIVIETIKNAHSAAFLFINSPILLISNVGSGDNKDKITNTFKEIVYPENHYYLRVTSLHVSTFNINDLPNLGEEGKKALQKRKKGAKFNASCLGTCILFDTRDFKNKNNRASHSITHSSMPFSLELPYLIVGIGPDLNCIDKLMVSLPVDVDNLDKKKMWFKEELYGLPNSHYLIHMVDPNDPDSWEVSLDSKPSSALAMVILVVFIIILCMGSIICYLKYKERKDDFMVDGINNQLF
eukprot:GAHX01001008.1.p1 GENE.GAHX01001008.1~~GAHX01001008.1.p1  ORF type:complete len:667 (+),score=152.73 GAHX01001008.1:41-2002(+)